MNDDLISRQAALDIYDDYNIAAENGELGAYRKHRKRLLELPSAQPERKRGKWHITDAYPHNVYCSECHTRFAQTHWAVWEDGSLPRNFCPHCGAKMES